MNFSFPKDFLFGSACSACQIEGAAYEGGKTDNVFDYYARKDPERFSGDLADVCADFYHHYRDDIKIMKKFGLKAFRFSIAWARICPDGPDSYNQKGVDYYNDMINALVENDIVPMFDLFHCDLPMWVINKGGIANREFIGWFTSYAKICFEKFGDRVKLWSTVNEPSINVFGAYAYESNGPFLKDLTLALKASHHMLLAHYATVKLYHSMNLPGKIGAVNHFAPVYTDSLDPKDEAAAERRRAYYSGWWLDPMMKGEYPANVICYPFIADKMPENYAKELKAAFEPMDFIGINYYNPEFARFKQDDELCIEGFSDTSLPKDAYGFLRYPQGLFDSMMYLKNAYPGAEIYITENGIAAAREDGQPTSVHDDFRITYMRDHLREVSKSIAAGVNLKGYFNWTIMDTYEGYAGGFKYDFGLLAVDYKTLERTPRDSFYYYKKIIEAGRVE